MNYEIWIIYNQVNSGKLGHIWNLDDWEKMSQLSYYIILEYNPHLTENRKVLT